MNSIGKMMVVMAAGMLMNVNPAMGAKDADKEAAQASPYANDLGPAKVDVEKYPKEVISGYKLLLDKCTKCHTAARPLNAQFVELKGGEAEVLKVLVGKDSENEALYKIDEAVWKRYVKRMAAKPGCELSKAEDQKAIYRFLVHDSKVRKTADQAASWIKHRRQLLEQFKAQYPQRYQELYGSPSK